MNSKIQHLKARYDLAVSQKEQEVKELALLEASLRHCEEARQILQSVAEAVQQEAHHRVCSIVTRCLRAVFGEDYSFTIEFVKRRGKTEADLWLEKDGMKLDPLSASGGGVVDVISFALRVAALVLMRPCKRLLLCLDEPFRHLSANYRERVAVLLRSLAEELGIQMILVTHHPEFSSLGRVLEL